MKLAIFDFDGTLLMKDTLPSLGKEWVKQKRSKMKYCLVYLSIMPVLLLYMMKLVSRESMKGQAFRKFNRMFTKMTRAEINEFFSKAYSGLKNHFNQSVLDEVKAAREQGFHCVLLSGSYLDLMQIVAEDLGIDTVIAAELAFKDGAYDHYGETPFIDGKSKVTLLQKAFADKDVDWAGSRCFADSFADIMLMQVVGEPVAVNPDSGLLTHASKHNWKVIAS